MNFSVTQFGKPLDKSKYTWDENTKTFSTKENFLVLDFTDIKGVTFKTGHTCNFNTGDDCIFTTGYCCTFNTGDHCTFNTCNDCIFTTGYYCSFKTGFDCIFKTTNNCFFNTGSGCSFDTGFGCMFKTGENCIFKTGKNCFVTRYDVEGVIEIPVNQTIKLNGFHISGYTVIEEENKVSCNGKIVEIDGKKYKLVETD